MEIRYPWHITQIVRDIPKSQEFSSSEIKVILREVFSIENKKVSPTLQDMNCLKRTHAGSLGGWDDPNRYIKRAQPGKVCKKCLTDLV